MAQTPNLRSLDEIIKQISQTFVAKSGVNGLYDGSAGKSLIEAAALSDFRNQQDIIAALNSIDIDRAEEADLDKIGFARGIRRPQAKPATGVVTLFSKNFTKIATRIYASTAAPPSGSFSINVSDASLFPTTGSIYIGRGSNNVEGPIAYTSITPVGNYFTINLTTATTKNHNNNESVVLAQGGNRAVSVGTVVQTEANATSPSVTFRILTNVIIQDGDDTLTNVPVLCTEIGTIGNVPAGAIKAYSSEPFPGAGVTNPTDFITGKDTMSDQSYRLLIKEFEQNKTKGTDQAIKSAAINVTSSDDNKTVASAELQKPSNRREPAILYIDDGTAYQPIFAGQGFEQVVDNANGGEKFLQLQNEDITKALVETSFTAPFSLTDGYKLSIKIGGVLSEHTFAAADFATQNAADTFEVVNSINANNNLLFSARASKDSKRFVIFAKNFEFEDVEVVVPSGVNDVNANDFLGLSENLTYSLRLYKNDELLIKDGEVPTIFTEPQANWAAMSSGETLTIKVDKSIYITYTFVDADFVPYNFPTVSSNNTLESWANVINDKVAGVTATVEGNELKLVSNKGADDNASLTIDASLSTLGSKMFGVAAGFIIDLGKTSDYTLNRATAQIELAEVLASGDVITAGSRNTRAFLDSDEISTGSVNLPAATVSTADPRLWVILDAACQKISNTATASSQITITNPASNRWRFTSSVSSAFSNVLVNDWVIISDDGIYAHDQDFIGAFRVSAVGASFFEFYLTNSLGTVGGPLSVQSSNGFSFIRSELGEVQELSLLTGLQTITAHATNINSQLQGGLASPVNGKILRIASNTFGLNGLVCLAGQTAASSALGFTSGDMDSSTITHTAFSESQKSELTFPSFIHDTIAIGDSSTPPLSVVTSTNLQTLGVTEDQLIAFLNPYGHLSSNKNVYTHINALSGTTLTLRAQAKLRDIIANDRYYPAFPFMFEPLDNLVAIIDKDPVNKSLNIKLGRKGEVNSSQLPTQTQFKAYDADAGPSADYPDQFGNNFDFKDFYIYFKARQILDPSGVNNKMLVNSVRFGPTGEGIRFGIAYPSGPAAVMTHIISPSRYADILVQLASGAERLGGSWDSTTQFDVTNPGGTTFRYTYNGLGTAPLFVTNASIAVGDIVNISSTSDFNADNSGTFKLSAVTDTYFEITNPFGVVESNIQLNTAADLRFYPLTAASNKASDVETYVAANLQDYVTITQLESGAGVISTSTYDDQAGTSRYVQLVDGFNVCSSSSIGTTASPTNQFNLKVPLQIPESDPDYTLVGQEFYIVPAMAEQISRFLNIFAVTGLSSLANIGVSSDAGKIQIYSNQFGSNGAVLVSGGSANESGGPVISTGALISQSTIRPQVTGVSRSGGTVTLRTIERHDISVGDIIRVDSVSNTTFNGTFTVSARTAKTVQYAQTEPTLTIDTSPTGAVRSSNVVTITTTTPTFLAIGDQVTISGVTDASFNGTFIVLSLPSSSSFTYAQVGANATSGSGSVTNVASGNGTVSLPFTRLQINKANYAGLQSRQWLKLSNQEHQQKPVGFSTTTTLSITSVNTVNITAGTGSFQTTRSHSGDSTTQMKVSQQGEFVCMSWTGTGTQPNFVAGGVQEGDWVRITGNFASVNEGIFKIAKLYGNNSIYFENPIALEEEVILSAATDLRFYSYDSIMPGDQLKIQTSILGASNIGTYTIAASPFPTSSSVSITTNFAANAAATLLDTSFNQVLFIEKDPYVAYARLLNIYRDPSNINGYNLILNTDILPQKINVSGVGTINSASKLDFKTTVQSGEDSYKYYQGLISAVGQTIRGKSEDPVGYPGIAAAGSYIEIDAPLPRRIQVSIVVRNRTGIVFSTIKSRVQSAVAAYVNSLGVGQPVVFSEIISVVQEINGVQAVSIDSPLYDTSNDQIEVNFNEKAVIVDAVADVIVSLAT